MAQARGKMAAYHQSVLKGRMIRTAAQLDKIDRVRATFLDNPIPQEDLMKIPAAAARSITTASVLFLVFVHSAQSQEAQIDPKLTEVWQPIPPVVMPGIGTRPPSDAIVLFDGKDLSGWERTAGGPAKWTVSGGVMTVAKGS